MVFISIKCPQCQNDKVRKNGKTRNGKQQYRCMNTECTKRYFIDEYTNKGYKPEIKLQIIQMTLNGSGIRDISRVLGISQTTVMNELKERG